MHTLFPVAAPFFLKGSVANVHTLTVSSIFSGATATEEACDLHRLRRSSLSLTNDPDR